MTSSPGPMPSVFSAVCRAAVQELSAKAPGARRNVANSPSNRFVFGPVEIQRERRVSTTSRISSSPIVGGEKERNSLRLGGAEPTVIVLLPGPGARCRTRNAGRPRGRYKRRSRARTLRLVERLWQKHLGFSADAPASPAATSMLQMCVRVATIRKRPAPASQAHVRICPWRHVLRR
jgi:hypothetical protein